MNGKKVTSKLDKKIQWYSNTINYVLNEILDRNLQILKVRRDWDTIFEKLVDKPFDSMIQRIILIDHKDDFFVTWYPWTWWCAAF